MISGRRAQEAVAMRGILNRQAMLACLVILAAASVAACTARPASVSTAPPDSQQATSPAAIAAASPASSAPAGQPSATPTAAGTVQNLVEPTAAMSDQTAYMDGTSEGMFKAIGTGPWQVTIPINPDVCQEIQFFPAAVLVAWSLPTVPPADICPA
jgi:hypothetical protein